MLTGAVLAKYLPLPVAIPVAFLSHFVLDSLPHFGFEDFEVSKKYRKLFSQVLSVDITAFLALSSWLIISGHWLWFVVGLIAYSPDLIWVYRYIFEEQFGKISPKRGNPFLDFHSGIQLEHRWGMFVELFFATCMFLIVR
jgi:hypothetical protein